jgi:hypothetical protein
VVLRVGYQLWTLAHILCVASRNLIDHIGDEIIVDNSARIDVTA